MTSMHSEMIVVQGGTRLVGEVRISGAKNSALKLIAATLLAKGVTTLHNVPLISDIDIMVQVVETLGARVQRSGDTFVIDTTDVHSWEAPYELVSKMRASIAVLGPLIARFKKASVAMPGGCNLGARKVDMHMIGLEALGTTFENSHGDIVAHVEDELVGAYIPLEFPSVGATENTMMAAVVAKGTTTIDNAAREPEIEDLANMLNAMGARISGAGTSTIVIEGVSRSDLHACEHTVVGDRIEAGTFLVGAALTKGDVTVRGVNPDHMRMTLMKLEAMGATIEYGSDWVRTTCDKRLASIDLQTLPHPGFPTDMQAQFMLLATLAQGTSVITENIFENRYMAAAELARMGAHITIDNHHAIVEGVSQLQGARVKATDLRCGAALVLAGIVAEGETQIRRIYHIDRGYEDYVGKLSSLGACISREIDVEQDSF